MKNTTQPYGGLLQKFRRLLPEAELDRLARESGFMVRRARKLTALGFVVSLFMSLSLRLTSLSGWASQLAGLCGRHLSKQGLDSRLTAKASRFTKKVLEQLLRQGMEMRRQVRRTLENFTSVLVQDSTCFGLKDTLKEAFKGNVSRGVQKAVLRVGAVLELCSMQLQQLKITPYTHNDQSAASNVHSLVRTATLVIRDLGYWSVDSLWKIMGRGAYFLSRLKYGVTLYTSKGSPLPLDDLLCGRRVDRWVRLSGAHPLAVRLVVIPVASQVAEQRVRKAKNNRNRRLNHSEAYYRFLAYDIFVTNVGAQLCTAAELRGLYRLRWQIEVLFRGLKSGALNLQEMIDSVKVKAERVRTAVTLALCFVVLTLQQLYAPFQKEIQKTFGRWLSLIKVLQWACTNLVLFACLGKDELLSLLHRCCCYEKRKRLCLPQKLQRLS